MKRRRGAHVSETPATAWLKEHGLVFTEHPYDHVERGGALHSAAVLGLDRGRNLAVWLEA